MWYGSDFGNESTAGGFLNTTTQADSPAKKGLQSVIPVSVRQIRACQEEDFKLFGMNTQILHVVGILRDYEVQSTKATYNIEDHTGRIKAVWWLENDSDNAPNLPAVKEGSYNLQIKANNPGATLANSMSFMDENMADNGQAGLTPMQQKVFKILQTNLTPAGMDRQTVIGHFPQSQIREVNNALEFLINEGHAYSTIDNDHFKVTDTMMLSGNDFRNESTAGGFLNNTTIQADSPDKKENVRRLQSVIPVSVRQIRACQEEDFKLFGMNTQILHVVGILRDYEVQSTKATYNIEDHTGRIKAVWWLENDSDNAPNLPAVKEGSYVQVFGSLRPQEGEKILMILKMFSVEDANIVTSHLLQVIHTRLAAEALTKNSNLQIKANNPGATLANSMSFMDENMADNGQAGLTPMQQKVFKILQTNLTPAGMDRQTVIGHFPQSQIREIKLQSVIPVSVRQIRACQEEDFKLFGMDTQILHVVGILRYYEVQSLKVIYSIEDHTGCIKAVLWLEDYGDNVPNLPAVKEGSYVQVFGSLRPQEGEKMLLIFKMFSVEDANVVTSHLLQVIHTRLEAEALSKNSINPGATLANSMSIVDDNMADNDLAGLAPVQQKVFRILQTTNLTPVGMDRQTLIGHFPQSQIREVNNALEFLMNEGHAYTTIDNDHFRVTDTM
ncbi:hypothetical protein NQ318_018539 [Aromia moschata]|uniref:Replication protein A C-terminal domain-containing protein n=1 Tax=Aromia moschata TaxID=1265417 RepID=A0AAV8ZGH6_9CUCU|nr:hypothetical protein NQ318_018539 [Aromia moschata]